MDGPEFARQERISALVESAKAVAGNDPNTAVSYLNDAAAFIATEKFKSEVFTMLEQRNIRHAEGPPLAVFQVYGQAIPYVAFKYDPVFSLQDVMRSFETFLCGDLPVVWRKLPEADGRGKYYCRLVQVSPAVFDVVTSDSYKNMTLEDREDGLGTAVTSGVREYA